MEDLLTKLKPKSLQFSLAQLNEIRESQSHRTLFYSQEVDQIHINFIFYNKFFDEKYWSEDLTLKIMYIDLFHETEIVSKEFTLEVSPDENEVIESVSIDGDNFTWDEGKYNCSIMMGEVVLISETLTIADSDVTNIIPESFIDILSLKLFLGESNSDEKEDRRIYLSRFHSQVTKFIWAELQVASIIDEDWEGEFVISFYNDIKELVARKKKTILFEADGLDNVISVTKIMAGHGSDTIITWEVDQYTVEISFLNKIIATAYFEVGESNSSSQVKTLIPSKEVQANKRITQVGAEEEIFQEIDSLVGLEHIKQKLHDHYKYVKYLKLRTEKGLNELRDINLNFIFTGNPGTGKTTVANLLGKIYKQLGLLSKSTVFEVDRSDLVGRYIGDTAPQTKEVIEKARGGILFIDEAYSLFRNDEKDFGVEAIEVLVKELSDGKGDLAIIVAGYPKEMEEFIESNTGLKSRFNFTYEFTDYTPDELQQISQRMLTQKSLSLTNEADEELYKIIIEKYRNRDKHFGNARFINSLIEEAQVNLGLRIVQSNKSDSYTAEELSTITIEDVIKIKENANAKIVNLPINEKLLKETLAQLNGLVGLDTVKKRIRELVKLARYYKESNKSLLNSISLHNVFIGNPGTGKTTVARIIADIYKALGLLERGHLVECSRDSLVAGYVGQTAIKTKSVIDESFGGVLFIDEAYSLSQGDSPNDFGQEAIEVLLKSMEDHRGQFGIITAGYTDEMINFLDTNPGLRSRFDSIIEFEDFSPSELTVITSNMLADNNTIIEENALDHLNKFFEFHFNERDKFFGNARFVRKVVDKVIRNQHLRLAEIPLEQRTQEVSTKIIFDDVDDFAAQKDFITRNRKSMGF